MGLIFSCRALGRGFCGGSCGREEHKELGLRRCNLSGAACGEVGGRDGRDLVLFVTERALLLLGCLLMTPHPRFSRDKPRFTDTLDVIKFLCKDLWTLVFRKQIDNLKTNHRVSSRCYCTSDTQGLPIITSCFFDRGSTSSRIIHSSHSRA